jgi:hypothetical protein
MEDFPMMGFEEEQIVPASKKPYTIGTCSFYTAIANGKRVFAWPLSATSPEGPCFFVGHFSAQRGQSKERLQCLFREEIEDHKRRNNTDRPPTKRLGVCDPLLLSCLIHHLTLGGN